jgi:transcriptional regulator of heat shock response
MESRPQQLLRLIIDDYIKTAEPVGSRYLVEQYKLDISPATVRNEMSLLEEEGYLRHAHTSSGRIPTEKAYQFYLKEFLGKGGKGGEGGKGGREFGKMAYEENKESAVKSIAKRLVEISGETAIVAFDPNWSFYTGVSNLMQKPEFHDSVPALAELVDQFDAVVSDMFDRVSHEPQVFIGSHNPFGDQMTTIIVRYDFPNTAGGILGLVGPMRMDYARNLALLEAAKKIINELSEE